MNSRPSNREPFDRWFRAAVGLFALLSGIVGLIALYFVVIPTVNKEPILIGLGVVLGWGSSVVQSEFGGSVTGRRLAEKATDRIGQNNQQRS